MIPRIGKTKIDALYAGPDLKYVYNPAKSRREIWHRCTHGDREWVLFNAMPARVFEESFIGPVNFFPAFVGILLDRAWSANGDPAPVAGNFVAANEIGGGMLLRGLGAAADDWIALHTGANYPVDIDESPHLHLIVELPALTTLYSLIGLVGASGLETGNGAAWTTPDDGIWIEFDTDVDTNMRFVTSIGGMQTSTSVGTPGTTHAGLQIRVSDDGAQAQLVYRGTILATHTTNLPTAQLKPLSMIGSRAMVVRDLHLHDSRMIFDHGGLF